VYGKFTPKKPAYNVNDYVTFACDDGFELKGNYVIHCRPGGVWSTDFPTCHRKHMQ